MKAFLYAWACAGVSLIMASGCADKKPPPDLTHETARVLQSPSYAHVIRVGTNPTGAYQFLYVDVKALDDLPPEEAYAVLNAALADNCRGSIESRHQLELGYRICTLLRERFLLRGKKRLMAIWRESKGEEVRTCVTGAFADHGDTDVVPELVAGLRGEENNFVLERVDRDLHTLTGLPGYGKGIGDPVFNWRALHSYWLGATDRVRERLPSPRTPGSYQAK